jgi:glycosyltransferase involved in cell wall biosynthesis
LALEALQQQSYPHREIVVVDQADDDAVRRLAESHGARRVTHIGTLGAARQTGVDASHGEIVAFTDDDCVADPSWLDALAAGFAAHPEALGVQGKTVTDHAAMTPFTRQIEQLEGGVPHRTCNIAYRREILRDLGGFDTHLIRGEDVVLGMRVLERGPIVFAPDAVIAHPPRPKDWADRRAWRVLLESELHFKRTYPQYATARSQTLSLQKAEHVVSRWLLLPVRRYWRWHYAYFRRNPRDYLRHVPLILREKLALFSLLPFFLQQWRATSSRRGRAPHRAVTRRHPQRHRPGGPTPGEYPRPGKRR